MPGNGRGRLTNIGISLNSPKHKKIASAIKMALKQNEYRVSADVIDVGAAFSNCQHLKSLSKVWCYAVDNGKVDWLEY